MGCPPQHWPLIGPAHDPSPCFVHSCRISLAANVDAGTGSLAPVGLLCWHGVAWRDLECDESLTGTHVTLAQCLNRIGP